MERTQVLTQVQDIFRDILDDEEIVLSNGTAADAIDGWDSLTHIQLVVAIEKMFKVRFSSREILSWRNVGEMVDSLIAKL